jgi:hypothetical protein
VAADGSYTFSIPQAHVDDFMHPRELDALDADGRTVASAWVAAVAYWRGQNR